MSPGLNWERAKAYEKLRRPPAAKLVRVTAGVVIREPFASRVMCANGHPWTPGSTRWRVRRDKGEAAATRDCLVCKRESERRRRERRAQGAVDMEAA